MYTGCSVCDCMNKYINIYYYELNCDMYENAAETESVTVSNIAQYYQIRYITTSRHQDV